VHLELNRWAPGAPAGFFTRRLAEEWLDAVLVQARAGTLPGAVRTGASFADACSEYLRYLEFDRQRKPSTLRDARATIRNHWLPAFGDWRLEDVSAEAVERSARELGRWFADSLGEPPEGGQHAAFPAALNDALDLAARAGDLRDRPDELEAVQQFLPAELAAA